MRTIEVARKLAEAGRKEDAQKGYYLALQKMDTEALEPMEQLEAASFLFFSQWDHRLPFTIFVSLYNQGHFQDEIMNLMLQAFYLPNVQKQRKRYDRNCRALARYPYFFRDGFPDFDALPILFFPFDDQGFVPFLQAENRFGEYVDFNDPVIDRYFFKDLENPILAEDVFSQYQLEYLNDNVRKSEWVGRENHIYLHYTDWNQFCGYLPCLDFVQLLKDKKLVFLMEEEISQYPIDFKARFGIDYSQYPVKPIGIREVNRLIWHTQLSAHNGGDFFNEIFYGHPNLLAFESLMLDQVTELVQEQRKNLQQLAQEPDRITQELIRLQHPTDKDFLVATFLNTDVINSTIPKDSRIVPALFFQPHFSNVSSNICANETQDKAIISSNQYEEISQSPIFKQFKYIKTFTPMRRITTSYGATVRFMRMSAEESNWESIVADAFTERLLNRSFMVDKWDRLYRDSVLVRFEDGKLNPKATFTALAEFLDIPYTESMTYCSGRAGVNPESYQGNARGFDPVTVYRTYDDYVDDDDRCLLEYFLRDAYKTYGYDFHYYHGEAVDMEWVKEKLMGFHKLDKLIVDTAKKYLDNNTSENAVVLSDNTVYEKDEGNRLMAEHQLEGYKRNRLKVTEILMKGLQFVNKQSQPLQFMKKLELDPALLEQPLYH